MRHFIADTHFGASPMLIRGMLRRYSATNKLFESTEAHDEHLLKCINAVVEPKDELFIVGDFAGENPGKYRARIKCKHVYLIRGNHDPYQKCKNVFGEMPWMKTVKLRSSRGTLNCVLCHFPLAYWDKSHKGWGHVHGHTHGQREVTLDDAFGYQRRMMDVGVDALRELTEHYFPISEWELYDRFTSLEGHDHADYYEMLQFNRDKRHGFDPQTRPEFNEGDYE
jgi:calcineurin-like phosphoesterase family protein